MIEKIITKTVMGCHFVSNGYAEGSTEICTLTQLSTWANKLNLLRKKKKVSWFLLTANVHVGVVD